MNSLYKNKRIKTCKIIIESFETPVISLEWLPKPLNTKVLSGNKNDVLKELKVYLKSISFHKPSISKVMDAVNKTSTLYIGKQVSNNYCKSVISVFNSETQLCYVITVGYQLVRLEKKVDETKCNNHGENIFQKRLCQRFGGKLVARYKVAFDKIRFSKLLDMIKEHVVKELYKNVSTRFVSSNNGIEFVVPKEMTFSLSDRVEIGVYFRGTYNDYEFGSAGVFGTNVTLTVTYQGNRIIESVTTPKEYSEEIVKNIEEQAEMFEKVCDIAKKFIQSKNATINR